jgi:hypothetical protein
MCAVLSVPVKLSGAAGEGVYIRIRQGFGVLLVHLFHFVSILCSA